MVKTCKKSSISQAEDDTNDQCPCIEIDDSENWDECEAICLQTDNQLIIALNWWKNLDQGSQEYK